MYKLISFQFQKHAMAYVYCSDPEWGTLMEVHHEPIEKNYQLLEEIGK